MDPEQPEHTPHADNNDSQTDELDQSAARAELVWRLLEEGELDRASREAEALRAAAPESPEVVAVCGAVLTARGQFDAALAELRRAFELSPEGEGARYLLDAAELQLYARDQVEAAIELCTQALDITTHEDELIDGVLLHAEALISLGDNDDEAHKLLGELESCVIEEAALMCRLGDLYATMGDWRDAESAFARAVELDPGWADGYHGLGGAYEAQERRADMIEAWLRVLELDAEAPRPGFGLSPEELEQAVERALAELPDNVRAHLGNVPIFVADAPAEDMVREGYDPRLLGLFSGVPLPERSHIVDGQIPTIDTIHVFQRNLERISQDREHLLHEVRITVLHETAHFFGLDDDALHEIGLG